MFKKKTKIHIAFCDCHVFSENIFRQSLTDGKYSRKKRGLGMFFIFSSSVCTQQWA